MRYVISQSHAFVLPENCAERESDWNRSCIRNINAAVECKVVTTAIRLRLDCDSTDVRLPFDCNSTVFFDRATTMRRPIRYDHMALQNIRRIFRIGVVARRLEDSLPDHARPRRVMMIKDPTLSTLLSAV